MIADIVSRSHLSDMSEDLATAWPQCRSMYVYVGEGRRGERLRLNLFISTNNWHIQHKAPLEYRLYVITASH